MKTSTDPGVEEMLRMVEYMQPPGDLLFARLCGSYGYNLATNMSDTDVDGVYVARLDDILGMYKVKESVTKRGGDRCLHEIGKFCKLLIKGNPNIIEMLHTKKNSYCSGKWMRLVAERERFISQSAIRQYLGYMQGQMKRLRKGMSLHTTGGEYNTKWACHFLRLGKDMLRLINHEPPMVWHEGVFQQHLLDVKNGKWEAETTLGFGNEMIKKAESLKPWDYPEEGDAEWLNDWLIDIRKNGVGVPTDKAAYDKYRPKEFSC